MSAITSIEIENYRGFKKFRADGLSRVNLIVGKNNAGKTSFLEAVEAAVSSGSHFQLYRASFERGEWRTTVGVPNSVDIDVRHWFHNHSLEAGDRLSIEATGGRGAVYEFDSELEYLHSAPLPRFVQNGLFLKRTKIEGDPDYFPLSPDGFVQAGSPLYFVPDGFGRSRPVGFVTTARLSANDLSRLWPSVALTPREESTVAALRLVESTIDRVAVLGSGDSASVQVLLRDMRAPVPLGSLGEGASRLLALSLYLASTGGGFLMVDEIENGIHYSVMPKLWRFLVMNARALDVQLFVSTHSKDFLEALARLHRDEPELANDVSVHRLDAGATKSVRLDARLIDIAVDGDQEVR